LASGRSRQSAGELSAEASELHRDVLSVVAHELGGIASALDLRTAAMSKAIAERDLAALSELVEQLRVAIRAVRFVRGTDGSGILNPGRLQSLSEWWKFAERLTSVVLPRGVQVDARLLDAHLNAAQASGLTWVWLAACKQVAESGIKTPCTVTLRSDPAGHGSREVTLVAEVDSERLPSENGATSRWARYAEKVARDCGIAVNSWEHDGSVVRWSCTLHV
jgi:hypothetical protein